MFLSSFIAPSPIARSHFDGKISETHSNRSFPNMKKSQKEKRTRRRRRDLLVKKARQQIIPKADQLRAKKANASERRGPLVASFLSVRGDFYLSLSLSLSLRVHSFNSSIVIFLVSLFLSLHMHACTFTHISCMYSCVYIYTRYGLQSRHREAIAICLGPHILEIEKSGLFLPRLLFYTCS